MKIKVDKTDFIKFCIVIVILLYICCVVVLNVSTLSRTGEFYGLMPFKAFTGEYIGATLILFFAALLGTFFSVSSYIFESESGFGLTFQGKSNGYARWATAKEVKKQLKPVDPKAYTADAAGLAVMNDGKKLWVDDGEAHNIVIGATGSGKTQAVVFPMVQSLAKKGESMIITDPKGEIYEQSGEMLRERGYNIVLLNFRNPQNGNGWNPMALPYKLYKEDNTDKAIELLDDLALNILYEEKNGNADPFWEKSAADYFTGLALGLFEDAKESQINLNSMNLMSSLGEERFGGPNNNYMKEYFNAKDPSRPAYINASGVVFTAEETKQGVLATFKQKIKIFSSRDNLSEMLSRSDFDMKDIGRQKTAVFMIVQDEKKTLHSLATIFIKQCYETLIDVAQESGGKLPHRTNFILDEFANMPPLKDVTTMVTAARSRLIRFTFIIQNYAQLTQVYGKENAETIKGNCGNIVYLISSELAALEEISKLCGDQKSKKDDKTASTPLATVSDLQRMKQFDQIVLRMRMQPFKTSFTPNFKIDWGDQKYPKVEYPEREKRPVQVFDVREFVKEKRQQKIREMMMENSGPGTAPMSGGSGIMPASPFGPPTPPTPTAPSGSSSQSVDIDDLVRKIDAKIAEIEKEEKAKAAENKKPIPEEKPIPVVKPEAKPKTESIISTERIENKVNDIISGNYPQNSLDNVDKKVDKVENTTRETIIPSNKATTPTVSSAPEKPTISLDEVDENQFFDDFFED